MSGRLLSPDEWAIEEDPELIKALKSKKTETKVKINFLDKDEVFKIISFSLATQ